MTKNFEPLRASILLPQFLHSLIRVKNLGYRIHIFLYVTSLSVFSAAAFSDDCNKVLTILSSNTQTPRGNPNSLNSPHHPEYLRAKLPPQPKLKYQGTSFFRAGKRATIPTWSEEHYIAVDGDRPYVYKVHPRTQKLELVKNSFDSVKNVEKALAWGPNRTLVAAGMDGSISILRLNPESNILNLLSKFQTGGKITADPIWGPDRTVAVSIQENNKNYVLLLRFSPETGGVELVDKHEIPDLTNANLFRPDGTMANLGANGHLSVFKYNNSTKKLGLIDQTQLPSKTTAKPSWGPHDMLAIADRGSPDWGPNDMIAFVGNDQKLNVVKIYPKTKRLEAIDIPQVPNPQTAAWGPEGTLAVAGWNGLYVFKFNPETKKIDLLDSYNPSDGFYFASLAWGPNATLVVNSLKGTYSFKLTDGRSWFSTVKDLLKPTSNKYLP